MTKAVEGLPNRQPPEGGSTQRVSPQGRDQSDKADAETSRPSVKRLAGGLVAMPSTAPIDPRTVLLSDPEVPESERFCWNCQEPVGRSDSDQPGVLAGQCPVCRSPFNFRPSLSPGDLVAGQYEVQGCLAHGGLGWLYLAIDRNVSDRWVVLKGLRNPLDFEAHVVALAERQFLSEAAYSSIVKIYNFVEHRSTQHAPDGYIVMEYIGGRSLRALLDRQSPSRMPVADAIAYVMEILPALDYLHSCGLAYNDLKPDNIMVADGEVKLIDLGAVAALGSGGSIYGTPGYMAPEITMTGPTVLSDIYSVGRTLAALIIDMPRDQNGHRSAGIPAPSERAIFRRYPWLYRFLVRATDPDPQRRFTSAYAMHSQLAGVLRKVLATDTGREHPQASIAFGSLRGDFGIETMIGQIDGMIEGTGSGRAITAREVIAALPVPLIDRRDPSSAMLSSLQHGDPAHTLEALRQARQRIVDGTIEKPESFGVESTLAAIRAHLDLGQADVASQLIDGLAIDTNADWRVAWYSGIAAMLHDEHACAYRHFDAVHSILPGEIAPELALAATAQLHLQQTEDDDIDRWHTAAVVHYRTVWRTNHGVISAAFGLARQLESRGARLQAVSVLDEVPVASRHHNVARLTGCLLLLSRPVAELTSVDLDAAAERVESHRDDPRAMPLRTVVLWVALAWLNAGGRPDDADRILGYPATERGLRLGLEASLRVLAKLAPDRLHRYRLVDLANQVRPRTRW
ncbi:serine/threonine-protein kinase [Nocardia sp. CDC160]|uniref:serine/threonine-protein kinase n=1 Tax=Nocardia sp. CDC160 TaxID=3112166 RepID=UPI002DB706F8|nr:tetratricopeptide repeat protein [Nocardia sp. CDC160]MEC3920228.1 tetratricopeptide repeat protein [Nocardia sp. CDC160]